MTNKETDIIEKMIAAYNSHAGHHADYESMKAACDVAREDVPTWQPIESAPKHGEYILLVGKSGYPVIGRWHNGIYDTGWMIDGDFQEDPTHWMPLPQPPMHISKACARTNPQNNKLRHQND